MTTKKRIVLAAIVALAVAGLASGLGTVMRQNADYSADYVAAQMAQQRISFKPAEFLTPEEKAQPCVVANAGKALRTGKQAECYANHFIAVHLEQYGKGKTYAEWGVDEFALIDQITAAKEDGASSRRIAALEADLAEIRATRAVLFQGETLRGILLTSFGFSTLGEKAGQAATVAFGVGAALAAIAAIGLAGVGLTALRTRTVGTLAPASS